MGVVSWYAGLVAKLGWRASTLRKGCFCMEIMEIRKRRLI